MNCKTVNTATLPARSGWLGALVGRIVRSNLSRGERASISPMFALLLVPISGSVAFAVELGGVMYVQRSLQNAADAAALAAAHVNTGPVSTATGTTVLMEARAAVQPYGYVHGGNITVTADQTTCPTGTTAGSVCYEAIVSDVFPLTFSRLVGFIGDRTLGTNGRGQLVRARAVAVAKGGGTSTDICVWTFNHLQTNGTPDADLSGCVALSNNTMTCNGNGIHSAYAIAENAVSGNCADASPENNFSNADPDLFPADPYEERASNIPANPCTGATPYPQFSVQGNSYSVPTAARPTNEIAGTLTGDVNGNVTLCGDVQLKDDVNLADGATLVIYNGRLDVKGHKFNAPSGTLVFSGTAGSYSHFPMDSANGSGTGELNIRAPTTDGDPWKDIAIYQDPSLSSGVSFTYSGNKPTWTLFGVMYFPDASVTFNGIVNKYAGEACQILVAYNATISGTGKVIGDQSDCHDSNITPPTFTSASTRERLVL